MIFSSPVYKRDVFNCNNCDEWVAHGDIYCRYCGKQFNKVDVEEMKAAASEGLSISKAPLHNSDNETLRCPACSEFLAYSYIYCKKCGIELTEEHRAAMTGKDQPDRVHSLNALLFVFLILLAIFMLGVYLLIY